MSKRLFIGYEDYKVKLSLIKLSFPYDDFIVVPYPNLKDFNLVTDGIKCRIKTPDKPCLEGSKIAFDRTISVPDLMLQDKFIKCDKYKDADVIITCEDLGYTTIKAVVLINENNKLITITTKSYKYMTNSKVLFEGTLAVFFCTKQEFFHILSLAKENNVYYPSEFFKNLSNSGFDLTESDVNSIREMLKSDDDEIVATGVSLIMTSNYVKYKRTIFRLLDSLECYYRMPADPIYEIICCGFFIRRLIQSQYSMKTSNIEKEDLELSEKCFKQNYHKLCHFINIYD